MERLIGCCGLDCEKCDARIATLTNDNTLREKTAALWTKLNGVTITPEMIHCTGCRVEGAKTPVTIYLPLGLWQPAIGMGHLVA